MIPVRIYFSQWKRFSINTPETFISNSTQIDWAGSSFSHNNTANVLFKPPRGSHTITAHLNHNRIMLLPNEIWKQIYIFYTRSSQMHSFPPAAFSMPTDRRALWDASNFELYSNCGESIANIGKVHAPRNIYGKLPVVAHRLYVYRAYQDRIEQNEIIVPPSHTIISCCPYPSPQHHPNRYSASTHSHRLSFWVSSAMADAAHISFLLELSKTQPQHSPIKYKLCVAQHAICGLDSIYIRYKWNDALAKPSIFPSGSKQTRGGGLAEENESNAQRSKAGWYTIVFVVVGVVWNVHICVKGGIPSGVCVCLPLEKGFGDTQSHRIHKRHRATCCPFYRVEPHWVSVVGCWV